VQRFKDQYLTSIDQHLTHCLTSIDQFLGGTPLRRRNSPAKAATKRALTAAAGPGFDQYLTSI
jgi:hypothetical protein